jgi:ribosomal 30S subunit maturation factor RimM
MDAKLDFEGITDALAKNIARNEELFSEFAKLLGLTEDEFEYYLDNLVGHENVTADTDRV